MGASENRSGDQDIVAGRDVAARTDIGHSRRRLAIKVVHLHDSGAAARAFDNCRVGAGRESDDHSGLGVALRSKTAGLDLG